MPNKTIKEDAVKWPSLKKYPCKKGKGEHEYLEPKIKYPPSIRYIYKMSGGGILDTDKLINFNQSATTIDGDLLKEPKLLRTDIRIGLETICKNCGHKAISFLSDKII